MAEIIELNMVTRLDIPAERVIARAAEVEFVEIVVVGFTKAGEFYFTSNKADAGTIIYLMEMAKKRLLDLCEENEPLHVG